MLTLIMLEPINVAIAIYYSKVTKCRVTQLLLEPSKSGRNISPNGISDSSMALTRANDL